MAGCKQMEIYARSWRKVYSDLELVGMRSHVRIALTPLASWSLGVSRMEAIYADHISGS